MCSYLVYRTLNILFNVVAGSPHSLTIVLHYPTFIVTAHISLKSGKCEQNGADSLAIQATLIQVWNLIIVIHFAFIRVPTLLRLKCTRPLDKTKLGTSLAITPTSYEGQDPTR
jgi:hypothetical protein